MWFELSLSHCVELHQEPFQALVEQRQARA